MKTKIDLINEAFYKVMLEENAGSYKRYIQSIQRKLIDNVDSLTSEKVKSIIMSERLNVDNMALLYLIHNAVITLMNKPTKKERNNILPIVGIMTIYSIRNPERFYRNVVDNIKGVRNERARGLIIEYKKSNFKVLESVKKKAITNMQRSISKAKLSKRILGDYNELREKVPLEKLKNELISKYNSKVNVERALDTEIHANSEMARVEQNKELGYTHKIWKTQGDNKVRETNWHNQVANKRIPIDSDFRAGGMVASYPSDERLPPRERIRCRCYLLYE